MRKVGKKVGSCTYAHRKYEKSIVPEDELKAAKSKAGSSINGYTCVRYNRRSKSIAFQFSPDFDTADEPVLSKTILVKEDGDIVVTDSGANPYIWHHKWMWVSDRYSGFDVEASKKRSELWAGHVSKKEMSKIGRKNFWDSIKKRWEGQYVGVC